MRSVRQATCASRRPSIPPAWSAARPSPSLLLLAHIPLISNKPSRRTLGEHLNLTSRTSRLCVSQVSCPAKSVTLPHLPQRRMAARAVPPVKLQLKMPKARYRRDMGEIQTRHGRDTDETWARYRRDMGGEIQMRYGRHADEIWARYRDAGGIQARSGRDLGEIWVRCIRH